MNRFDEAEVHVHFICYMHHQHANSAVHMYVRMQPTTAVFEQTFPALKGADVVSPLVMLSAYNDSSRLLQYDMV